MIVATMFFIYQSQDGNPFGDGLTFDMIYCNYAHKENAENLLVSVFAIATIFSIAPSL